jgi:hypothetical protein
MNSAILEKVAGFKIVSSSGAVATVVTFQILIVKIIVGKCSVNMVVVYFSTPQLKRYRTSILLRL